MLHSNQLVLDEQVYLDKWNGKSGALDVQFVGTRLKSTHDKHGLVRIIYSEGYFYDRTFINDKSDGLGIEFWSGTVNIYLYKDGSRKSNFSFDRSFAEKLHYNKRSGIELDHLTPQHFNPAVEEPKPYKQIQDEKQESKEQE